MRPRMLLLAVLTTVGLAGSLEIGPGPDANAASSGPPQAWKQEPRTGDVIVHFKRGATLADVGEALDAADAEATASTSGSGLVLLKPEAWQSVDAAVAALRADPDVDFAEPDIVLSVVRAPTDPMYTQYQWSLPQIGLPTAWNTTTGSASVIVAVVDTGVDARHPDLAGKVVAGYNFVSKNTNTADDHFHGTFVAGIIAATANNRQGGAGVCWSCKIMPVKVLSSSGSGSTFAVSQGIDFAVAHGAKVINLSLGGGGTSSLQASVDHAWNAGVIVVAASGNNNGPVSYPAAYANAIAAGSTDQNGARSTFSNFGPQLDLMAPGQGIMGPLCTCHGYRGGYATGSGTSFAAPHVSGVVALMISAGITNKTTIVNTLTSTATDMCAPGYDQMTGAGRVNAAKAVAGSDAAVGAVACAGYSAASPTPSPSPSLSPTPTPTRTPAAPPSSSPAPTVTPAPAAPQPYAVAWGTQNTPATMARRGATSVTISFTNTGTLIWRRGGINSVRLSYRWLRGACPGTTAAVAVGQKTILPADVSPGGSVSKVAVRVVAPASAGVYCLQYDLMQGAMWFSSQGAAVLARTVTVN